MKTGQDSTQKQVFLSKSMKDQLITLGDLQDFKLQMLFEIKQLLKDLVGRPIKTWLKSHEVRKLLGISPGTLQTFRNNGTIPFTKIGGIVYYNSSDICSIMEKQKLVKL